MNAPVPNDLPRVSVPRLLLALALGVIMSAILMVCILIGSATNAQAAPATPVKLELSVLKEARTAASDGTTKIDLVPVASITPGDRLVYILTYSNTGTKPVGQVVLDYPLPEGLAYRGATDGSLPPQVSADGVHFAPSVSGQPITALRWHVSGEIAPGAHGVVSFKATLN
jgi:uncharacterized repeat protein (TIGR01451 family)